MNAALSATQQVARIRDCGVSVAVAESCTGGMLAAALTSVPGSTAFFVGGVIAYANEVKIRCLRVPETLLAEAGAVSEAVALAMARGIREMMNTQVGVGITGVAGPDGGTTEKPVGLVWMAMADANKAEARRFQFDGQREQVRLAACQAALLWLESLVLNKGKDDE